MSTKKSTDRIPDFARNQRGTISVLTAVTMVPFIIAAGTAVEMARANRTLANMQKAVDSAALAGAATDKPVMLADGDLLTGDAAKIYVAQRMVDANLPEQIKMTAEAPQITINGDEVVVDLAAEMPTSLMGLVGIKTVSLNVTAAADAPIDSTPCIVALGADGGGIKIGGTVAVQAEECWLHSNKEGPKSIDIVGKTTINAAGSCSVGSTSVSNQAAVHEWQKVNCDPLPDPLAGWTHPTIPSTCDFINYSAPGGTSITLTPGRYCGGLELSGYDKVIIEEGIYYITGGPLKITSKANVTGAGVGFYLAKDVPSATINGAATVSLSAPTAGPMHGLLFAMEAVDPAVSTLISAKINAGSALDLAGSLYLPTATLDISGNSANISTATQIIAHSVDMTGTSNLAFKADFGLAGYPTFGQFASTIKLIK